MEPRTVRCMSEQPSTPAITAPPPNQIPPPSTRRPRVREVSSRFMSPISSSSSSSAGDLHLVTSNSPRNQTHRSISAQRSRRQLKMSEGDENRVETTRSLDSPFPQHGSKKNHPLPHHQSSTKPFKENGHRLDTPNPMLPPPSRSRIQQQRLLTTPSAATKLLRSSLVDGEDNSNNNHALSRSLSDDCSVFRDVRSSISSVKSVGLSLPPVVPSSKGEVTKKQKKVLGQIADVHSLKLLHNRYFQWRFANAKGEVKTQAQKVQAERMFYSLGLKMAELSDSVQKKRMELQRLLRVKAVTEIAEAQIPCLEEWTVIEEDYSNCLSETTEALLNASLRLPLDADIKVETKELAEALAVASKSMEGIVQNIGNFVPKTREMETLMSELARVSSIEKASVEECGIALLKTHSSHIEECYLRSHLIQQHKQFELHERTTLV